MFIESGNSHQLSDGLSGKSILHECRAVLLSLEILYSCDPFLSIADHLTEKVCETRPTELCGAGTIEIPVIDGFPVRWGAELLWSSLYG